MQDLDNNIYTGPWAIGRVERRVQLEMISLHASHQLSSFSSHMVHQSSSFISHGPSIVGLANAVHKKFLGKGS